MKKHLFQQFLIACVLACSTASAQSFRVLVLASRVRDHQAMIAAARPFFQRMADSRGFALDFTDDTSQVNDANLQRYKVFVMLQLAPFDLSYAQQEALQRFVEKGNGFVGVHAAGLTGRSFLAPGTRYWTWYEQFLGGVVYTPHPPRQQATVVVEDANHPSMKGLPATFRMTDDWYEFDHSPRNNVHVLAGLDEHSYHPNRPMGDHPIVWTNQAYRRMIYIGIGADSSALADPHYRTLLRNAIGWAASPSNYIPPISSRDGKVYYEKVYPYPVAIDRPEAYLRAVQWFRQTGLGKGLEISDPDAGLVAGKVTFDVSTGGSSLAQPGPGGFTGAACDHYTLQCDLEIRVTDTGYVFTCSHFREKALDRGVTNDYSKIEYRWWDYHAGNPWSAADQPLFEGLNDHVQTLMRSFKADIAVVRGAPPIFRVLALYENGGHHIAYSARAREWLDSVALDSNFRVDYITNTDSITDVFLDKYQLFLQLDYAPYAWKPAAVAAFQRYIEEGRGGWVGFHHATLLGEFDGYPMWQWFSDFMGDIRWKDYIARFARAEVHLEMHDHPVLVGVPDSFPVQKEEWYTYDKSPRPNVQVLAHVDESSYYPDTTVKMGDHPVIWTNPRMKARNVYIFMGHDPILFDDSVYRRIVRNAIFWAARTRPQPPPRFRALAFYSTTVETDHVEFARDAIRFYSRLAANERFVFDTTSDWTRMTPDHLRPYQVILWLNDFPQNGSERAAFEQYMEGGGAWLGFHVSAYNDPYTRWPWFVRFLGGPVFKDNSWPPIPAHLLVDDTLHPLTRGIPGNYTGPVNEWYRWDPDPRKDPDVHVLVTLDPAQYPLGKKDRLFQGDVPVVWTNRRYHMLYMNMGHGDAIFDSQEQNQMFANALLWMGSDLQP